MTILIRHSKTIDSAGKVISRKLSREIAQVVILNQSCDVTFVLFFTFTLFISPFAHCCKPKQLLLVDGEMLSIDLEEGQILVHINSSKMI